MEHAATSDNGTSGGVDAEPGLTERNSATVRGEETLAGGDGAKASDAAPSAYGPAGGTTDAVEEGGDAADS